jgi:hypothetical protein
LVKTLLLSRYCFILELKMKKMIQKLLILAVIVTPVLGVVWSHEASAATTKYYYTCQKKADNYEVVFYKGSVKDKTYKWPVSYGKKCLDVTYLKEQTKKTQIKTDKSATAKNKYDSAKKKAAEIVKAAKDAKAGKGTTGGDGGNSGGSTSGGSSSTDCATTVLKVGCNDEGGGIWAILNIVLNIMTVGVGILAMVGITIAAFTYATASDSMEKVQKSKDRIFQIVIGIIVYGALWALLQFLIPGGVL